MDSQNTAAVLGFTHAHARTLVRTYIYYLIQFWYTEVFTRAVHYQM